MKSAAEIEYYLTDHRAFENNGASRSPVWLKELRADAIKQFSTLGFPTVAEEDWKFTNILPLTRVPFHHTTVGQPQEVDREAIKGLVVGGSSKSLLVFVNGHFSQPLSDVSSLPREVVVGSLADAMTAHDDRIRRHLCSRLPLQKYSFAALNTAFVQDGAFVYVPDGVDVQTTIQLLYLSTGAKEGHSAAYPRNLIILGENAKATVVESYAGLTGAVYLTNAVSEFFLDKESALDYVKVQRETDTAFHIGTMQVEQERKSRFTAFSLAVGSSIARNDINITVKGDSCQTMLDGLYIAAKDQLIDHHTLIDHTQPDCSSREIFKGIVTGNSRAVFNGKIFVRREAQRTDSKQTNKNLLLSDKATVDTKPQLEIFADDVKCTHGATVGGLDAASLFYVKSRGITEEAGRALLTVGFASEVTSYINDEALRKHVDLLIIGRLQENVVRTPLPEIVHSGIKMS